MLEGYRVLDLTDRKGFLCGKMLGDLGADVIKVERPGGEPDREIGPFYHDIPDPEKSLLWFAYNTSKRGITLDIATQEGCNIFKKLAKEADFIIESFPPGYMGELGLGYEALSKLNPRIILTSITPFGQAGPYKGHKGSDIVAMAMGGLMYIIGDPDRAPLHVGVEQAYPQAGAQAAAATMIAHHYRQATGEGQHVDVSMQEALVTAVLLGSVVWQEVQTTVQRAGPKVWSWDLNRRIIYPCKNGFVCWVSHVSVQGGKTNNMVRWMDSEGMAPEFLKQVDFTAIGWEDVTQPQLESWEEAIGRFFITHTRAELLEGAQKWEVLLYPLSTIKDVTESPQLTFRNYWQELEYPELGTSITHPGIYFKSTELTPRIRCRAPLIGEHNEEVYQNELGLSKEELATLKQKGII